MNCRSAGLIAHAATKEPASLPPPSRDTPSARSATASCWLPERLLIGRADGKSFADKHNFWLSQREPPCQRAIYHHAVSVWGSMVHGDSPQLMNDLVREEFAGCLSLLVRRCLSMGLTLAVTLLLPPSPLRPSVGPTERDQIKTDRFHDSRVIPALFPSVGVNRLRASPAITMEY